VTAAELGEIVEIVLNQLLKEGGASQSLASTRTNEDHISDRGGSTPMDRECFRKLDWASPQEQADSFDLTIPLGGFGGRPISLSANANHRSLDQCSHTEPTITASRRRNVVCKLKDQKG
jgi:hypothetical protein